MQGEGREPREAGLRKLEKAEQLPGASRRDPACDTWPRAQGN